MTMLFRLIAILFLLMLPVTAMVPVLSALTVGRHPELDDFERHLFMSVNMIGALVAAPLTGWIADRSGRRTTLIVAALVVNGATLFLIAGDWSYPLTLAFRFIEGGAHMTSLSLLMTLAAEYARRNGLGATMGAAGAAISLGVAAGAPLGGWLGAETATQVPWLSGWLCMGLAIMTAWLLHDIPETQHGESHRQGKKTGIFGPLSSNRLLLVPYAFTFVDRLTVGFIVSTLSLYMGTILQFSPARIGMTMAAFLLPFSLLTFPAGLLCHYCNRLGMMIVGSLLYGLFLFALVVAPAQSLSWIMIAGGVVAALMYAPTLVLTAELALPKQRAMTMAGFNFAGSLGFAIGPLLSGALLTGFREIWMNPYPAVFAVIAAMEILVALAVVPLWRHGRMGQGKIAPASPLA